MRGYEAPSFMSVLSCVLELYSTFKNTILPVCGIGILLE